MVSSKSMEHRGPMGIWWPWTGRLQEEQHGMVPAKVKERITGSANGMPIMVGL